MQAKASSRTARPQVIHYHTFPTVLGHCALGWSTEGIVAFLLPARSEAETRRALLRQWNAEAAPPPAWAKRLVARVQRHLAGEPQDFSADHLEAPLDLRAVSEFYRRVYEATSTIPAGRVRTYGEIARLIRAPQAARAVGQALGRNPIALLIPCHRVVGSQRSPGGFSAPGGLGTKARMLEAEGVELNVSPRRRAPSREANKDRA